MPKTIICFENEERSCLYNSQVLQQIRTCYREELLVMVGAGEFSACGTPLTPGCRDRAGEYVKAGADLVLTLPAAGILGGYGKKEFAGAALVQRLRTNEQLIIPCEPGPGQSPADCGKELRSIAMLIFREGNGYRGRLKEAFAEGKSFRDAQYSAVCDCMPEAREILSRQINRHALWLLDSMLQLYYMPRREFIAVQGQEPGGKDAGFSGKSSGSSGKSSGSSGEGSEKQRESERTADLQQKAAFEQRLALKTAELLAEGSMDRLIDISGSTTQMAEALFENQERIRSADSLTRIAEMLRPAPVDRVRLFLLKAILGIRKIHMQICGLHEFVPYARVCAENPEKADLLKQLEERSWVPFVREKEPYPEEAGNYGYLLEADRRAGELAAGPGN
ncbi:MAG: nucleotidyltransferase family protein [Parasporobacterium sp.]|nr:nucleotidyltransferase family protein [Parasporobacterium sp.]